MDDTGFDCLRFERLDGDVLRITIDRPGDDRNAELNAIDGRMHAELTRLFTELAHEHEARAVVLTGRGRAFSAGGDFDWFPTLADPVRLEHLRQEAKRLVYGLLDVPVPIVAAVNGHAMGLGATIATLCDAVFMARSATIGDPHVKVGVVAGDGGTLSWPAAVGAVRAKRYLLTGDPLDAAEAERIGLVTEVVDDDELAETALTFARRLAAGAPLAIQYTKAAINAGLKAQAAVLFDQALASEIRTFGTADHAEALAALAERRPPRFTGR